MRLHTLVLLALAVLFGIGLVGCRSEAKIRSLLKHDATEIRASAEVAFGQLRLEAESKGLQGSRAEAWMETNGLEQLKDRTATKWREACKNRGAEDEISREVAKECGLNQYLPVHMVNPVPVIEESSEEPRSSYSGFVMYLALWFSVMSIPIFVALARKDRAVALLSLVSAVGLPLGFIGYFLFELGTNSSELRVLFFAFYATIWFYPVHGAVLFTMLLLAGLHRPTRTDKAPATVVLRDAAPPQVSCRTCGAWSPWGTKFCGQCGSTIDYSQPQPPPAPRPPQLRLPGRRQ